MSFNKLKTRTNKQAIELVKNDSISIDRVILIQTSDEVCIQRVLGRRIDPLTSKTYNIFFNEFAPPTNEIRDRVLKREADLDRRYVKGRLSNYHKQLGSVLQHFRGKIFSVNGEKPFHEVRNDIENALHSEIVVVEAMKVEEVKEAKAKKLKKDKIKKKKQKKENHEQCVICLDAPAEFLVVPCGHQCGCQACLNNIRDRKCPICRNILSGIVRVFKSGVKEESEVDDVEQMDIDNENVVHDIPEGVQGQSSTVLPVHEGEGEGDGGWSAAALEVGNDQQLRDFEKNVAKDIKITTNLLDDPKTISISVQVPDILLRVPIDVCCVIDVSGSMGEDAKFQDPNDETKSRSEGMSVLDIVKHAVKTVIHTLTDQDRLSIVSFDSNAQLNYSLSEMNAGGKSQAVLAVENLRPLDSTNIWAGMQSGLESLRNNPTSSNGIPRKRFLMLLTDGQPVQSPPNGEHDALQKYFEKYPDFKCQVNTFGFGYALKSKVMTDISEKGYGTFSFIPDAKIVGTCFVNAIANACSNLSQNCKIHVLSENNEDVDGSSSPFEKTNWGTVINIGCLQYGQIRNVTIKFKNEISKDIIVEYESSSGESQKIKSRINITPNNAESVFSYAYANLCETLEKVIQLCDTKKGSLANELLKTLHGKIVSYEARLNINDERVKRITDDVNGRMLKSISSVERYNRWGQHYLRAILRAHKLQVRTNFMDTSLQNYGGTLFNRLQEEGGKIFLTLQMKKTTDYAQQFGYATRAQTTQTKQNTQNNSTSYTIPQNSVSSTTYYAGSGGGCFDEQSEVIAYGKGSVKVSDVKKGDDLQIITMDRYIGVAKVICVVRIERESNEMIQLLAGKLKITPRHPIHVGRKWLYPIDYMEHNPDKAVKTTSSSKYVYNFVLDKKEVCLLVNKYECVTFGHGFKEAWHPFYATDDVIKVLSKQPGYEDGFVDVKGSLKLLK